MQVRVCFGAGERSFMTEQIQPQSSRRLRSDAEIIAKQRVFISLLIIFALAMAFLALGEKFYPRGHHVIWIRLATLPFFLLLLRRWLDYVRVRPPQIIVEARRLLELGRHQAAREKFLEAEKKIDDKIERRINRARKLLQNGLAVDVKSELRLEAARCLLMIDEQVQAVNELRKLQPLLPQRADVGIILADELCRQGQEDEARLVLFSCLPYLDAIDRQDLMGRQRLIFLLGNQPLPNRSFYYGQIIRERIVLTLLILCTSLQTIQLIFRVM